MGRYLRRLRLSSPFVISTVFVVALVVAVGCGGFVYPPPKIPEELQKEVFHVSDPIALLSFEPGRSKGNIIGALHDWPLQPGEVSIPAGNLTYVGQFAVVTKSDEDGMPTGAEGTRKVFFHDQAPQLTFTDARGYGTGQEIALDSISLSFAFKENHKIVGVRMITRQKSAQPFTFKDRKIQAPGRRDSADTLQGDYSADFGGYVLHSLNE